MFCILSAISRVSSEVDPPAPQVISQNVGLYCAILSCLSNKFSTPCDTAAQDRQLATDVCFGYVQPAKGFSTAVNTLSAAACWQLAPTSDCFVAGATSSVLGGKNSKEKKGRCCCMLLFILSTTFIVATRCLDQTLLD